MQTTTTTTTTTTTATATTRSLSCRGVTFESRSVTPVLPSSSAPDEPERPNGGRWVWLPWNQGNSFKIYPVGVGVGEVSRRSSSHFCDMEDDGDDNDDESSIIVVVDDDDIEEQKVERQQSSTTLPLDHQSKRRSGSVRGGGATAKAKVSSSSRLSVILLDQGLFTVYKRLFVVCLALNMVALVLAASGHFAYAKARPALFCMGNILALTLCRSEAILRIVFWLAVKLLGGRRRYVPLFVKTATTSFLQSVGGIHSSCGVSSVAWLIYALVLSLAHHGTREIIAVSSTILSLLCVSCLAAFPLVRHLHHNVFERTHRFAGWTALALLWVFVLLSVGYDPDMHSYRNLKGPRLVMRQEFWLTFAITFFTILPWITVRRVSVSVTAPSGHASIIKFSGGVQPGILARISRSPLSEWHAFGIISHGKDSHMILAGAVGDFTKGLVSNPPTHLWVRGVHFAGLPYLVNMYKRVVLVATGSGICVFLSFLLQKGNADVCVVWVTKGVEHNFGTEIKEMMSGHPTNKVIVHDTALLGRPNVAQMTIEAAKNWKAEVVVVTSNPKGSKEVVEACKAVGISAFGPIWDS